MTLRIQKSCVDHNTTVRVCGRLEASQRQELSEQIESSAGIVAIDLEEVTIVDLEIVQFLARCEARGIELLNCSPYIREWISRENERGRKSIAICAPDAELRGSSGGSDRRARKILGHDDHTYEVQE